MFEKKAIRIRKEVGQPIYMIIRVDKDITINQIVSESEHFKKYQVDEEKDTSDKMEKKLNKRIKGKEMGDYIG